ncbi:phage tail tip lysozyme [Ancylobacter sp.]|uniref:phage tail tip lysozyme n=1 Tax=Ancylobacter sp. TaxID=1872567 RepID=UPI003BAA3E2F
MTPQEQYAIGKLVEMGWSPVAAAGIVGNLRQESGLNPTASHDNGTGYGIAGWRDPQPGQGRWTNLRNFAQEQGAPVDSLDTQLKFLDYELRGPEKSVGARLKAATDPRRAAATFIDYERPAGWKRGDPSGAHGYDNRTSAAAQLFDRFGAAPVAAAPARAPLNGGVIETAALPPVTDEPMIDVNAQPTGGAEDISDLIIEAPRAPLAQGNIDLSKRPVVKNADGTISTVRSMSFNEDGREILIPTVSDDGRIMSDDEAIDTYHKTGRHLGMFATPEEANAYAENLHNQQASLYGSDNISDLIAPSQRPREAAQSGDLPIAAAGAADAAPDAELGDFAEEALADPARAKRIEDRTKELGRGSGWLDAAMQGVTFGFGDELRAGVRSLQKGTSYDEEIEAERQALERYKQEHPYAALGSEVGGALLTAPFLPAVGVVKGAGLLGRAASAAKTGTAYGALYGAGTGEGLEGRATGAISGGALGGLTGGGASLGLDAAAGLGRAGINAVRAPFRGALNVENEAARRVGTALNQDLGGAPPALAELALRSAQKTAPAVVGDIGGETTKALARSSANTSPAGREALQIATQDRFPGQAGRFEDVLRGITGSQGDNAAVREGLKDAARQANAPAYKKAYQAGQSVWDSGLESLTGAPAMQTAIKDATNRSRNVAAVQGTPAPKNPFNVDEVTGTISLKTNPDGSVATPSLEFWDVVQRNLRSQSETLKRSGDADRAREVDALRRALLDKLDTTVPEFGAARKGAAQFFGAEDALEAGEKFAAKSSMPLDEARRAFNKLNGPEKKLFVEGWTAKTMDNLRRSADRRDVLKSMFNSAEERGKAEMLLGKNGAKQLESQIKVEDMMERFRAAVSGNSTTARQLQELGIAGGIGGGVASFSPTVLMASALAYFVRAGRNKIDERVARRVGEMLASDDPAVLRRALEMVSKQPALRGALDKASQWVAKALPAGTPTVDIPLGTRMVAGQEDQNGDKSPGMRPNQKDNSRK